MTRKIISAAKKRTGPVNKRRGFRSLKVSQGELKLLEAHGYRRLTEQKLRTLKRAHDRYLAATRMAEPVAGSQGLTLDEAEERVARYLESL